MWPVTHRIVFVCKSNHWEQLRCSISFICLGLQNCLFSARLSTASKALRSRWLVHAVSGLKTYPRSPGLWWYYHEWVCLRGWCCVSVLPTSHCILIKRQEPFSSEHSFVAVNKPAHRRTSSERLADRFHGVFNVVRSSSGKGGEGIHFLRFVLSIKEGKRKGG